MGGGGKNVFKIFLANIFCKAIRRKASAKIHKKYRRRTDITTVFRMLSLGLEMLHFTC